MQTTNSIFTLAVLASLALVTGCTGPVGPQGEAGQQGENGEDGAKGADGKNGERGAAGTAGATGAAGTPGASSSIKGGLSCVSNFSAGTYVVTFEMAKMSNGDVLSSAAVQGTNGVRSSGSGFWPASSADVGKATVFVLADGYGADNHGFFMISFNAGTNSMRVVANDPDLPSREMTYDFPSSACKSYGG